MPTTKETSNWICRESTRINYSCSLEVDKSYWNSGRVFVDIFLWRAVEEGWMPIEFHRRNKRFYWIYWNWTGDQRNRNWFCCPCEWVLHVLSPVAFNFIFDGQRLFLFFLSSSLLNGLYWNVQLGHIWTWLPFGHQPITVTSNTLSPADEWLVNPLTF